MSNALKTALITAGITLAVLAVVVLAGGPKKEDPETQLNDTGRKAVQGLAQLPMSFWVAEGKAKSSGSPVKQAQRIFFDLFGDAGKDFWERRENEANRDFEEGMDQDEIEEIREAKKQWKAAIKKWEQGDEGEQPGAKTTPWAGRALRRMVEVANATAAPGKYGVLAAWIAEADGLRKDKEVLAAYPSKGNIRYEWSKQDQNRVDGMVGSREVRVFGSSVNGSAGKLRAYVALWKGPLSASTGGSGIGLGMLILGPLLVGGLAYALSSAHSKNVKDLAREIDRLGSKGDPTRMLRAQGAEASGIARAVERMVSNLEFRSQHGDEDLDEIVDREKKVAEEIHGALISKNPPRLSNYEVETLFKPGFEIGGDHFEYFPIDDDHLGVILLDTNVRGITAALVMASARSYVRAAAPGVLSPAEVLRRVNRDLAGELPPGRHVTALYVVINTAEGKATVASAGHLPLLVYRHAAGKVAKVNPEGIALGLDQGPLFDRSLQEGDIPIEVGDRIVLYTDGALHIQNEEGEEFGESRFYESVAKEAPKNSQAFVNFVGSAIDQFHLPTPQNDDVTISTVKRLK